MCCSNPLTCDYLAVKYPYFCWNCLRSEKKKISFGLKVNLGLTIILDNNQPTILKLALVNFGTASVYYSTHRSKDDVSPPRYRNVNGRNFTAIMPRIVACMLPDGIQAPDKGPDYCVHCYKTCELQWLNFYLKKFKIVVIFLNY